MPRTAIILGASGLVGGHLLGNLLQEDRYTEIVSIGRRKLDQQHEKLRQEVVDFDRLREYGDAFAGGDDLYICLGTTRAAAGSAEAFRKVDLEYVLASAEMGLAGGCRRCALVSSVGADAGSSLLYPKTKGEAEDGLRIMGFSTLHILRPSSLLGERSEFRIGEVLSEPLMKLADAVLGKRMGKYRPVMASKVAKFMMDRMLTAQREGVIIYNSNEIVEG